MEYILCEIPDSRSSYSISYYTQYTEISYVNEIPLVEGEIWILDVAGPSPIRVDAVNQNS